MYVFLGVVFVVNMEREGGGGGGACVG